MRRLSLSKRRRRGRVGSAAERLVLRVLAAVWIVRFLVRRGRPALR